MSIHIQAVLTSYAFTSYKTFKQAIFFSYTTPTSNVSSDASSLDNAADAAPSSPTSRCASARHTIASTYSGWSGARWACTPPTRQPRRPGPPAGDDTAPGGPRFRPPPAPYSQLMAVGSAPLRHTRSHPLHVRRHSQVQVGKRIHWLQKQGFEGGTCQRPYFPVCACEMPALTSRSIGRSPGGGETQDRGGGMH